MTTNNEALLPCPFCGEASDLNVHVYGNGEDDAYVQCRECTTCGPDGGDREGAIAKWNHRAAPVASKPEPTWEQQCEASRQNFLAVAAEINNQSTDGIDPELLALAEKAVEASEKRNAEPLEKLTRLSEEMGLYPWQEPVGERAELISRLRDASTYVRRKSMLLSEFIPMLQQAAEMLEADAALLSADARELKRAQDSRDFYKTRCDLLQQWQSKMRDPERTTVCDILANGQTLPDPDGKRYGAADKVGGEAVLFISEEQLASVQDRDDESGKYLPVRKTPRGKFTLALYTRPALPAEPLPFVMHHDDPLLKELPDGTVVVLQRKLPTA